MTKARYNDQLEKTILYDMDDGWYGSDDVELSHYVRGKKTLCGACLPDVHTEKGYRHCEACSVRVCFNG